MIRFILSKVVNKINDLLYFFLFFRSMSSSPLPRRPNIIRRGHPSLHRTWLRSYLLDLFRIMILKHRLPQTSRPQILIPLFLHPRLFHRRTEHHHFHWRLIVRFEFFVLFCALSAF